jgi:hypothetical protein
MDKELIDAVRQQFMLLRELAEDVEAGNIVLASFKQHLEAAEQEFAERFPLT